MATFADFLPWVAMEVEKCPPNVMRDAVRRTVIDLCQYALLWREVEPSYSTIPGSQSYDFITGTRFGLVHKVLSAQIGESRNADLEPKTMEELDEIHPGWQSGKVTGSPSYITQVDPESFMLVPTPVAATPFTLTVALQPKASAATCPSFFLADYHDTIVTGAKARLFAVQNKSWSNPQLAAAYQLMYEAGRNVAKSRAGRSFGRVYLRVKAQFL